MEMISPEGPVYQAGTLSGNPVSLAAGIKTIEILERKNPYEKMKKNLDYFLHEIKDIFKEKGIAVSTPATATFFSIFFSEKEPENLEEVNKTDKEIFIKIYKKLFERGILFPPSPFEAIFLSIYHDKNLLGKVLEIIRNVIKKLK
ncbi:MAG: aspartate aminotransferase family protein, partial [candidate division WOR-3 bacterium]